MLLIPTTVVIVSVTAVQLRPQALAMRKVYIIPQLQSRINILRTTVFPLRQLLRFITVILSVQVFILGRFPVETQRSIEILRLVTIYIVGIHFQSIVLIQRRRGFIRPGNGFIGKRIRCLRVSFRMTCKMGIAVRSGERKFRLSFKVLCSSSKIPFRCVQRLRSI